MHKKKAGKLQTGSTFPKQYWLAVNGKPKTWFCRHPFIAPPDLVFTLLNIIYISTYSLTHCVLSGPNLALGETAELFPSSSAASLAYKAVDGNTSDAASSGACAQTTNSAHVWWKVDLGRPYSLTGIKIYNRERGGTFVVFLLFSRRYKVVGIY